MRLGKNSLSVDYFELHKALWPALNRGVLRGQYFYFETCLQSVYSFSMLKVDE